MRFLPPIRGDGSPWAGSTPRLRAMWVQMNVEKLQKMAGVVRTGGKGTVRRQVLSPGLLQCAAKGQGTGSRAWARHRRAG